MPVHLLAFWIFWISCGLLFYTFVGYHWLITAISRRSTFSDPSKVNEPSPDVTVVLVARNEASYIGERLRNLLEGDFPAQKLSILLVSDGSTDATVDEAKALHKTCIQLLDLPLSRGKAAGLNVGVAVCTSEIIVFADARQRFAPDAIPKLVTHFNNPKVGAVSGQLEIAKASSPTGSGVDLYWRKEKALRAAESRLDSCIGCTGAIYALRRSLFVPLPEDTLLDDVVIPMHITLRGFRVLHEPTAIAFDPRPLEPSAEMRRKQRTLAGGFQMAFRYPSWLAPWKNRLWWQLLSHKYLRLVAPLFLLSALVATWSLRDYSFFNLCLFGQLALYFLAVLGLVGMRWKICSLAAGFVFLNVMTIRGFIFYISRQTHRGWR